MKNNKCVVVFVFIVLMVIGLLLFTTCWMSGTKDLIVQYAGLVVTTLGFLIAINQLRLSSDQYFADMKKKEKDYLDLTIDVYSSKKNHSIKTQVINKSGEDKVINFAFILITKQDANIVGELEQIVKTYNWNVNLEQRTNCFYLIKPHVKKPLFEKELCIIPLSFYYSENVRIGNENPCFTYTFNQDDVQLEKGIYSVRFFIYPDIGYHRCTVDSLIVE